jgi:hypothetical protein
MRNFVVTGWAATFPVDSILFLSAEQISRRANQLEVADDSKTLGRWNIKAADLKAPAISKEDGAVCKCRTGVTFKRGELVGLIYSGSAPIATLTALDPIGSPSAKAVIDANKKRLERGRKVNAANKAKAEETAKNRAAKKKAGSPKRERKPAKTKPSKGGAADETAADKAKGKAASDLAGPVDKLV